MNVGFLFDMDGVIVDNHKFHYKAWEEISAKYGLTLNPSYYREKINGRTIGEIIKLLTGSDSPEEIRALGAEKETIYRKLYQPYLSPTPGLQQFLTNVSNLGIPMVVGTSAPKENVDFTINGLGIGHHFEDILDDRSVTLGKPNPEIYLKCAKSINRENSNCVVFEDALAGIEAAKAAGSKVVGLATSHDREELEADIIIDNFHQLNIEQVLELVS